MYYSPLRYPGGKSKLAPFMKLILNKMKLNGGVYVEPFAGGAGIAIELLLTEQVDHIVINDYDKALASFWNAVINENDRLISMIYDTPVTIDEWYRQREVLYTSKKMSFELGFATFFLNRTNHSGILKSGPIGGYEQNGKWRLDVRFNKEDLIKRIKNIGDRKKDITVYNKDANSLVKTYIPKYGSRCLVYFDPPYFDKGSELYLNYFTYKDHEKIEKTIREYIKCKWIITYDDIREIHRIYDGYTIKKFDLNYSAARKRKASELMIFPDEGMCLSNEEMKLQGLTMSFR